MNSQPVHNVCRRKSIGLFSARSLWFHLTTASLCSQGLLVTSKQKAHAQGQLEKNLENILAFLLATKSFNLMIVLRPSKKKKIFPNHVKSARVFAEYL